MKRHERGQRLLFWPRLYVWLGGGAAVLLVVVYLASLYGPQLKTQVLGTAVSSVLPEPSPTPVFPYILSLYHDSRLENLRNENYQDVLTQQPGPGMEPLYYCAYYQDKPGTYWVYSREEARRNCWFIQVGGEKVTHPYLMGYVYRQASGSATVPIIECLRKSNINFFGLLIGGFTSCEEYVKSVPPIEDSLLKNRFGNISISTGRVVGYYDPRATPLPPLPEPSPTPVFPYISYFDYQSLRQNALPQQPTPGMVQLYQCPYFKNTPGTYWVYSIDEAQRDCWFTYRAGPQKGKKETAYDFVGSVYRQASSSAAVPITDCLRDFDGTTHSDGLLYGGFTSCEEYVKSVPIEDPVFKERLVRYPYHTGRVVGYYAGPGSSPVPSAAPSPEPSAIPTVAPTPLPSVTPTLVPTIAPTPTGGQCYALVCPTNKTSKVCKPERVACNDSRCTDGPCASRLQRLCKILKNGCSNDDNVWCKLHKKYCASHDDRRDND